MKRKKMIGLLAVLVVVIFTANSLALVEGQIRQILKTETPPIDVAVSPNGKWIFVLTKPGNLLIYRADGKFNDKIAVGKHIDQIKAGPDEELLLLKSRNNKTIEILVLDFIQDINIAGSPFKGSKDAPVAVVVFEDFQ